LSEAQSSSEKSENQRMLTVLWWRDTIDLKFQSFFIILGPLLADRSKCVWACQPDFHYFLVLSCRNNWCYFPSHLQHLLLLVVELH
jgi:hypothetical protein